MDRYDDDDNDDDNDYDDNDDDNDDDDNDDDNDDDDDDVRLTHYKKRTFEYLNSIEYRTRHGHDWYWILPNGVL